MRMLRDFVVVLLVLGLAGPIVFQNREQLWNQWKVLTGFIEEHMMVPQGPESHAAMDSSPELPTTDQGEVSKNESMPPDNSSVQRDRERLAKLLQRLDDLLRKTTPDAENKKDG